MKIHSRYAAFGQLFAMIAALILGCIWLLGYPYFSLETLYGVVAALLASIVLFSLTVWSPVAHRVALALVLGAMLDIFVIRNDLAAIASYAVLAILAVVLRRRLQNSFFVVFGVIFTLGAMMNERRVLFDPIPPAQSVNAPSAETAPILVHLVLDEMGTFDSVPLDNQKKQDIEHLRAEYAKRGFRLFEDRLSTSTFTRHALATLVDLQSRPEGDNVQVLEKGEHYRIKQNQLHELFADRGWQVSIIQSDYVDVCANERFVCGTYSRVNHMDQYARVGADWRERAGYLAFETVTVFNNRDRGLWPLRWTIARFPDFKERVPRTGVKATRVLASFDLLERETQRIKGLATKSMVFIHLLLPHYPWIMDRECRLKPIAGWKTPNWVERRERDQQPILEAYWEQNYCTHKRVLSAVDELDAAMPGRIQYVIHGDHGPRILGGVKVADRRVLLANPNLDPLVRANLLAPFVAMRLSGQEKIRPAAGGTMQDLVRSALVEAAKQ